MARGRKPKSEATKKRTGNAGRREAQPEGSWGSIKATPEQPAHLDSYALAKWKQLVPELGKVPGLLATIDQDMLWIYCQAYAKYLDAQAHINASGTICVSEKGNYYMHPALAVQGQAVSQMTKIAQKFGLSPKDRLDIKLDAVEESNDPISAFLKLRAG